MTSSELTVLFSNSVAEHLERALMPLVARVEALEAKAAARLDSPAKAGAGVPSTTMVAAESITPDAMAAMLVAWLEHRGGLFRHDADGRFELDLNGIAGLERADAEFISQLTLWLRAPIRRQLGARSVQH
jgi:hypothetical protein